MALTANRAAALFGAVRARRAGSVGGEEDEEGPAPRGELVGDGVGEGENTAPADADVGDNGALLLESARGTGLMTSAGGGLWVDEVLAVGSGGGARAEDDEDLVVAMAGAADAE